MKIRSIAAFWTFWFCLFATQWLFTSVDWFPPGVVYRMPKWTAFNLSMVDEVLERTIHDPRSAKGYLVFIGDSVPHGDGYGRPSESLVAQMQKKVPTANLTSPSLAYPVQTKLLKHVLDHTQAPHILVEINPKWVVQNWTPDKFLSLDADLDAESKRSITKDFLKQSIRLLIRGFLLETPRDKLKYRLSNFTLYGFASGGFKRNSDSLWDSEEQQEVRPEYDIVNPRTEKVNALNLYRAYHAMPWETIDENKELNTLLDVMAHSNGRVTAWLVPLNPSWSRYLGVSEQASENDRKLRGKILRLKIPLASNIKLNPNEDYRDDMHLTVLGAQKVADHLVGTFFPENAK